MKRFKGEKFKIMPTILFGLLLYAKHHGVVEASGDMADFSDRITELTTEKIDQYYTDTIITGNNEEEPQRCAERVINFRKRFHEQHGKMNKTLGVEPTVGLGAALLIFVLVGVFAAGIAQAFQMVSISANTTRT